MAWLPLRARDGSIHLAFKYNAKDVLGAPPTKLSAGVVIQDSSRDKLPESLRQLAPNLSWYTGTILSAGLWADGMTQVEFHDPATNLGYVAPWPPWAFDLAKAALLSSKRVLIGSDGEPSGNNISAVLIINF